MGVLALGTVANALVLDDFSTGNINDKITAGSNSLFTPAAVPGGNRFVRHTVESNPLGLTHAVTITNGIMASDSKTQVDATTEIAWGVNAAGFAGVATDLNADLSAFSAFRIKVLSSDQPATLRIAVRANSNPVVQSAIKNIPINVNAMQAIDVDFSEFVGVNFADVDAISILLDTSASGDVVIDSFEAVPEPASMIALGLGAAALVARKRKA